MTDTAEESRSLVISRVSAFALVVLSIVTYAGFDATACPGDGGPEMAEASAQAIVCGAGDFYPWALVLWIAATAGGLVMQWWVTNRTIEPRRRLAGVVLPLLAPLLLFAVLRLPSESCTDEVRRTEPVERCVEPD